MKIESHEEARELADHFLREDQGQPRSSSKEIVDRLVLFFWTVGVRAKRVWIDLGVRPSATIEGQQVKAHPLYHEHRPKQSGAHWVARADGFIFDLAADLQSEQLPVPFIWKAK